jgi:HEAT repeat protein
LEALESLVTTSPTDLRRTVAPALAAVGSASARALLERAARDDVDPEVRQVCAAVLRD